MSNTNNKKRKLSRPRVTLPQKIIPFKNSDKKWHESWTEGRDLLDFPHPYRITMTGPPNSGKSTAVMNVLLRSNPMFERVIVIYPGGQQGTSEYDTLGEGVEYLMEIPEPDFFPAVKNKASKTLVIVDDFELKEIGRKQRANLDRLIGHVSTHRNVSVMLCAQEYFNVPTIARRCSNVQVFWKPRDMRNLGQMSQRVGQDLEELFKLCQSQKDSIWVDLTSRSPAPLRLNGYSIISRTEDNAVGEAQ